MLRNRSRHGERHTTQSCNLSQSFDHHTTLVFQQVALRSVSCWWGLAAVCYIQLTAVAVLEVLLSGQVFGLWVSPE